MVPFLPTWKDVHRLKRLRDELGRVYLAFCFICFKRTSAHPLRMGRPSTQCESDKV